MEILRNKPKLVAAERRSAAECATTNEAQVAASATLRELLRHRLRDASDSGSVGSSDLAFAQYQLAKKAAADPSDVECVLLLARLKARLNAGSRSRGQQQPMPEDSEHQQPSPFIPPTLSNEEWEKKYGALFSDRTGPMQAQRAEPVKYGPGNPGPEYFALMRERGRNV